MRTETIENTYNIYKYDELSQKAKQNYIENLNDDGFFWNSDYERTLEAFEDVFNIKVYNWRVGAFDYYDYDYKINDYYVGEIQDSTRLATWVNNNIIRKINKGKYYSKGKWENDKYTHKERYSKIFEGNYMPTGYCYDWDIFKNALACANYKEKFNNIHELIKACLDTFFECWRSDMEYCYTDEYAKEMAEANNYEFLEDGTIYC